jgi:hypothetical protein
MIAGRSLARDQTATYLSDLMMFTTFLRRSDTADLIGVHNACCFSLHLRFAGHLISASYFFLGEEGYWKHFIEKGARY